MKRIGGFIGSILPIFLTLIVSLVATVFVLFFGWIFSLVTGLTVWQAVVITSAGAILSTYTLHARLPRGNDILPVAILAPLSTLILLVTLLPLVWLIPLVSPLDSWQSCLVGAAMTFTVGHIVLNWLSDGVMEESYRQGNKGIFDTFDDDEEESWEEFIGSLDEGQYVVIRDRQTGMNLILETDSISPDELCPCESGRKYRNCHGQGQVQSQVAKRRRR